MDLPLAVAAALETYPAVRNVTLVGSRAEGRAHDLSDWDFVVETDDFDAVALELPRLVAPLEPIAEQWDPYAPHACYMLILRGPAKVDLLFLDERRDWSPAWEPSLGTLEAIDRHFWNWILWLEQKRTRDDRDPLDRGLADMHALLLGPMGVAGRPETITDAVDAFVEARARLERAYGITVPRSLEREVRPAVLRRQR